MKRLEFTTSGTCSKGIIIEIDDDTIQRVEFVGGCRGNLKGIATLAKGRKVSEIVENLSGIQCQNGTSCPDQLAKALKAELEGTVSE